MWSMADMALHGVHVFTDIQLHPDTWILTRKSEKKKKKIGAEPELLQSRAKLLSLSPADVDKPRLERKAVK